MKQIITLIIAAWVSTSAFANTDTSLNVLGSVWKNHPSNPSIQTKNDMIVGYGGADISHRPTYVSQTTV